MNIILPSDIINKIIGYIPTNSITKQKSIKLVSKQLYTMVKPIETDHCIIPHCNNKSGLHTTCKKKPMVGATLNFCPFVCNRTGSVILCNHHYKLGFTITESTYHYLIYNFSRCDTCHLYCKLSTTPSYDGALYCVCCRCRVAKLIKR